MSLDGFQQEHKHVNVKELTITKVIDLGYIEEMDEIGIGLSDIEKLMCEELAQRIIKSGLANFHETSSFESKQKVLKAHINIVEAGTKFANVTDEVFKIGDEEFTNEELIQAVKAQFPERLV